MIKKIILICMLSVFVVLLSYAASDTIVNLDTSSKDYYVKNTYNETGSKNIVTGIYLDYRLFDTLFEASILLIAVSGILFISKKDSDIT